MSEIYQFSIAVELLYNDEKILEEVNKYCEKYGVKYDSIDILNEKEDGAIYILKRESPIKEEKIKIYNNGKIYYLDLEGRDHFIE